MVKGVRGCSTLRSPNPSIRWAPLAIWAETLTGVAARYPGPPSWRAVTVHVPTPVALSNPRSALANWQAPPADRPTLRPEDAVAMTVRVSP